MDPRSISDRAEVTLSVALHTDEQVDLQVLPETVVLTRKPHTHADTCEVVLKGTGIQLDPRAVADMVAYVFLGVADTPDAPSTGAINTQENWRFAGTIEDDQDSYGDQPGEIRLSFVDFSGPLRRKKPVPARAVPHYSDTVEQAIQKILDAVPEAGERLTIRPTAALDDATLQKLTGKAGRKGPIPLPKKDCTAWEAIEFVCDKAGLLPPQVDRFELVVRRPQDAMPEYGTRDPNDPKMVFLFNDIEANVLAFSRRKRFVNTRLGVKVCGFDPVNRKPISAVYPDDDKLPPLKLAAGLTIRGAAQAAMASTRSSSKPQPASKRPARGKGKVTDSPKRFLQWSRTAHTVDACRDEARRIYIERESQEIEVTIETAEWDNDVLGLWNGDRIQFRANLDLESELRAIHLERDQIAYLREVLGLDPDAAKLVSLVYHQRRGDLFYVKQAQFRWSASAAPAVKLDLLNLIEI